MRLLAAALLCLLSVSTSAESRAPTEAEQQEVEQAMATALLQLHAGDSAAILASADPSLAALLLAERDLALAAPAELLLPPIGKVEKRCIALTSLVRIYALRRAYTPEAMERLSAAELLDLVLEIPLHPDASLRVRTPAEEGLSLEALAQARASLIGTRQARIHQGLMVLRGTLDNLWVTLALRQPDGQWRFNYLLYLATAPEIEMAFRLGYARYGATGGADPEIEFLRHSVPGTPTAEELLVLAEPPRPASVTCPPRLFAPPWAWLGAPP